MRSCEASSSVAPKTSDTTERRLAASALGRSSSLSARCSSLENSARHVALRSMPPWRTNQPQVL